MTFDMWVEPDYRYVERCYWYELWGKSAHTHIYIGCGMVYMLKDVEVLWFMTYVQLIWLLIYVECYQYDESTYFHVQDMDRESRYESTCCHVQDMDREQR